MVGSGLGHFLPKPDLSLYLTRYEKNIDNSGLLELVGHLDHLLWPVWRQEQIATGPSQRTTRQKEKTQAVQAQILSCTHGAHAQWGRVSGQTGMVPQTAFLFQQEPQIWRGPQKDPTRPPPVEPTPKQLAPYPPSLHWAGFFWPKMPIFTFWFFT
jgi:hypothetical protein